MRVRRWRARYFKVSDFSYDETKGKLICPAGKELYLLGRFLYSHRLGIVEPVFANICHIRGLDRFTLRGKVKVDIQWKLYNMVHNVCKIVRYSPRFQFA
jgi:hypothetical protein